jgi:hypothetical protein
MARTPPLLIDVIVQIPTTFVQCSGCELLFGLSGMSSTFHNEQLNAYPEDLREEAAALVAWTRHLRERFGRRVQVRLVDAMSVRGVWLSLRHRVRRYPAFIVGGRVVQIGLDQGKLDAAITATLEPTSSSCS